jgi:hypothetical protein
MKLRVTLATLSLLAFTAGMNPALADNGKAKGHAATHGNSASHAKSAKSHGSSVTKVAAATTTTHGKGALASELKGLNAVHANPNALAHAAPNSQVGRIALYRDAALVTIDKQILLDDAEADLALLPVPRSDAAITGDIAASQDIIDGYNADIAAALLLDPLADVSALEGLRDAEALVQDGYEQELLDAAAQNLALAEAQALVDAAAAEVEAAQVVEDGALLTASNGRTLSDDAIAYVRDVLGL